jgi:steroid 5-alpha reductase family enzyme
VTIALSAATILVVMLLTWGLSVRLQDVSIVDPVWGPSFALVAIVVAVAGGGDAAHRVILAVATSLWGLRLGSHLLRRKLHERGEDRRYAAMRSRDPARFAVRSLYTIFLTQGVLIWVISLPLQVAAGRHQEVGVVTVAGLVVFAVGLAFEAIGDEQLRAFKADPANRGQVMDRGLWRYTRHPNYFGDACVWWGLWLASGVWWTVFAPLVMSFLLIRVSGKGLLERDIAERRPGYAEYIRRTSGFVPLPPRR